jgi:phospholipid/cholesterol/gamma-HCH transport system permease protein
MFVFFERLLDRLLLRIEMLGRFAERCTFNVGHFSLFFFECAQTFFTTKPKIEKCIAQIDQIGVKSLGIIILTGTFAGMVFALQTYIGFQRVGGEQYIGAVIALGMIRELGPVLTALMTVGRAGSAITAELGTMEITEQIDALRTLRINTLQYLVVPRIVASVIALPLLTLFSTLCGIIGGYLICVHVLLLNSEDYMTSIRTYVELSDITGGIIKATVFGLILGSVATYKGFFTSGGARGIGISTTRAVVTSSVLILAANYFLTKLLEHL